MIRSLPARELSDAEVSKIAESDRVRRLDVTARCPDCGAITGFRVVGDGWSARAEFWPWFGEWYRFEE